VFERPTTPILEHWDGSEWSGVEIPRPRFGGGLTGIIAVALDDAWAVGWKANGGGLRPTPLTLHWNGSTWAKVANGIRPSDVSFSLASVWASAPDDVWAVGSTGPSGTVPRALIMHWNGARWSVIPPGPGGDFALSDVDGSASDDIWAIGGDGASFTAQHWDGSAWTATSLPKPPGVTYMTGLAVVGADDIWVVGFYQREDGSVSSLFLHWDGVSWSPVKGPNYGGSTQDNELLAADAVGTSVWAVGWLPGTGHALTDYLCTN